MYTKDCSVRWWRGGKGQGNVGKAKTGREIRGGQSIENTGAVDLLLIMVIGRCRIRGCGVYILLCLPVASLLRSKSVCKSWRALIESSCFVNQHHFKDDYNNYSLIVMDPSAFGRPSPNPDLYVSLLSGNSLEASVKLDLPDCCNVNLYNDSINEPPNCNRTFGNIGLSIVASCNGIVCLYNRFSSDIFLWNPATKHVRLLSKSPFPYQPEDGYFSLDICIGFGFDDKSNDYKVVRFFSLCKQPNVPTQSPAEAYNLSTDSWNIIDAISPVIVILSDPKAPYRNGTYCWLVVNDDFPQHKRIPEKYVLTFDFRNEVFGSLPLPDVESVDFPCLVILRENLACIYNVETFCDFTDDWRPWECEIWVLNEYGVKDSWTKLYTVGPFTISTLIAYAAGKIGISMNGEFFLIFLNKQICTYNLVTEEIKKVDVHGDLRNPIYLEVAAYKESLVSIKGGNNAADRETYAV
ncbi:hypothetical protein IFM89_003200 [Coptis chinensis]|uniref:Uncharacterized protein n=1 Tax=Coptis chinensis TaxID=261450 RepID=A0A835LGT8_9MAGN|nr:hypothetical protein IFM89_003200 [Coptis chinensis]